MEARRQCARWEAGFQEGLSPTSISLELTGWREGKNVMALIGFGQFASCLSLPPDPLNVSMKRLILSSPMALGDRVEPKDTTITP